MTDARLKSIEKKVDKLITLLVGVEGLEESTGFIGRTEARLGVLETFKSRITTGLTLVGIGGGATGGTSLWSHLFGGGS